MEARAICRGEGLKRGKRNESTERVNVGRAATEGGGGCGCVRVCVCTCGCVDVRAAGDAAASGTGEQGAGGTRPPEGTKIRV